MHSLEMEKIPLYSIYSGFYLDIYRIFTVTIKIIAKIFGYLNYLLYICIMKAEKEYTFTKSYSADKIEIVTVKESELSTEQKELLLGELIRKYNDMPSIIQARFMWRMLGEAIDTVQQNDLRDITA